MITFVPSSWGDYQIILKLACFLRCGVSTVHIKSQSRFCVSSLIKMSEYCKALEKEQGLLILMMDKQWYSKLKVTIIRQLLNLIKERQPVSVESCEIFSAWGHDQSLPLIPSISVN